MQLTQKELVKQAYALMYSIDSLILGRTPKLDMRYTCNRKVMQLIAKNKLSDKQRANAIALRRTRAIAKPKPYTNYLSNPITKDYLKHKSDIKYIHADTFDNARIVFSGNRHHWAKSGTDVKILAVLLKFFV